MELIKKLEFNKAITVYKKKTDGLIDDDSLKSFFDELLSSRSIFDDDIQKLSPDEQIEALKKKYPYKIHEKFDSDNTVSYSFCGFMFKTNPVNFPKNTDDFWKEKKLAYILIIEYLQFVVISKKYITTPKAITEELKYLAYKDFSHAFLSKDTIFQHFSMVNTDVSDTAVRGKSIDAVNLSKSVANTSLNQYVLRSYRMKENDTLFSVSMANSKLIQLGKKSSLNEFLEWTKSQCIILTKKNKVNSFIDSFADQEIFDIKKTGDPTFLLLLTHEILNNPVYDHLVIKRPSKPDIVLSENMTNVLINFGMNIINLTEINKRVLVHNKSKNTLVFNPKKLNRVYIKFKDNSPDVRLIDYINNKNLFIAGFNNYEYKYIAGTLFKDNTLLGNITSFLDVFDPDPELNNINFEKFENDVDSSAVEFPKGSEFEFIERKYKPEFDFVFCDDLGKEWADYICLNQSESRIAFFPAKANDVKTISASAFQEIVGQALKNIGNMTPSKEALKKKFGKYVKNQSALIYSKTHIDRMRQGNCSDFLNAWISMLGSPNYKKDLYLIVNFIDYNKLKSSLEELQRTKGKKCNYQNEVVQVLWLLSSLIGQAREQNVSVHIVCNIENNTD